MDSTYKVGEATIRHYGNGAYEVIRTGYRTVGAAWNHTTRYQFRTLVHGLQNAINCAIELTIWA